MYLLNFLLIITVLTLQDAWTMQDDQWDPNIKFFYPTDSEANSGYRTSRNPNSGNGPRFGWQNPILRAPTLSPRGPQYTTTRRIIFETERPGQVNFGDLQTGASDNRPWYETPRPQPVRPRPNPGTDNRPWWENPGESPKPGTVRPRPTSFPGRPEPMRRQECPPNTRTDPATTQCTPVGSVCGENMNFYADPTNKQYGHCDCSPEQGRPTVYHKETNKCYFVFQRAYCKEGEWLVPGEPPTCQYNPCSDWANDKLPNWNWARNDMGAARQGPVAIIDERKCTFLGEPCAREDDKNLTDNLVEAAENPNRARNGISLMYESGKLVCSREESPDRRPRPDWTPVCRQGLYNKWKLMGRCQ